MKNLLIDDEIQARKKHGYNNFRQAHCQEYYGKMKELGAQGGFNLKSHVSGLRFWLCISPEALNLRLETGFRL
jgi:hypothetical protein